MATSPGKAVSSRTADTVTISISPASASLAAGGTQQFSAAVSNASNAAVTWSVDGTVGGSAAAGTITTGGLYTAPSAGTHKITATSVADNTQIATASVTVSDSPPPPPITVAIAPTSATMLTGATQQFTATVSNASNTAVTWTVDGSAGGSASAGTITTGGLYTAPANAGTHNVSATSVADGSKHASAAVTVNAPAPPPPSSAQAVLTYHNDIARTGQQLNETTLTPANVSPDTFGKLFSWSVDGNVFAQPLYVPNVAIPGQGTFNVVYIATEHDSVYAFDADGAVKAPLWHRSFLDTGVTSVPTSYIGSSDLGPEVGVTSTPAIDPASGTMYVVAMTFENNAPIYRIHALDITTGADSIGPKVISATVPGTGDGSVNGQNTFTPKLQMQRPGLLLLNGKLYIGFGAFGDLGAYKGWMMTYDGTTLEQESVSTSTPTADYGGVWMSGAGLAADSSGNLFFVTGNGTFDNTGKNVGDAYVKMDSSLNVLDWFSPSNEAYLDLWDLDVGASGVVLLPDQSGDHTHLMVGSGKSGDVYLIDRDNLGHWNSSSNNNIVQYLPGGVGGNSTKEQFYGSPAYWNGNVYFAGSVDKLRQFSLSNGLLSSSPVAMSPTVITNARAATPSVSSDGTSNGIVWIVATTDGNAVLHAYQATNVGVELYNSTQAANGRDAAGTMSKFIPVTIANGRVYVAGHGGVWVYGLLH